MKNVMKKLKGFTLVELLVVVAIIGILATVVVVSYTGAQTKAKHNTTVATLNEALNNVSICVADSTATIPTVVAGSGICSSASVTSAKWPVASLNGYTITMPTVSSGGNITAGFSVSSAGTDSIDCTAITSCK